MTHDIARRLGHGGDARAAASRIKYFSSEGTMGVTNEAAQIHRDIYATEHRVEQLSQDTEATTIYEGVTQIRKTIIGRDIFGELWLGMGHGSESREPKTGSRETH